MLMYKVFFSTGEGTFKTVDRLNGADAASAEDHEVMGTAAYAREPDLVVTECGLTQPTFSPAASARPSGMKTLFETYADPATCWRSETSGPDTLDASQRVLCRVKLHGAVAGYADVVRAEGIEIVAVVSEEEREKLCPPDAPASAQMRLDKHGTQKWFDAEGKLHRDGDLPAIVYQRSSGATSTFGVCGQWFRHGLLHREGGKPAVVDSNDVESAEWWVNGVRHRDGDEPAMVQMAGQYRVWYKEGKIHREGDEPAIIDETVDYRAWYKHGVCCRDGGMPCVVSGSERFWEENGDTVRMETEEMTEWYKNGRRHRDDDEPALIERTDEESSARGFEGDVLKQSWYQNGLLHREGDKPAKFFVTPLCTSYGWFKHGREALREGDQPSVLIDYYHTTRQMRAEWYEDGHLSRYGDQPAVVTLSSHNQVTLEWYLRGTRARGGGLPLQEKVTLKDPCQDAKALALKKW
jgi:hypothetical protein